MLHSTADRFGRVSSEAKKVGCRSVKEKQVDHHARGFSLQRKRIAHKTGNPRLLKTNFHTFRYWNGTMIYHSRPDPYYVMQRLGHKSIKNTLLYVQLEEALFQGEHEYISKVAKTEKEICSLVEAGFEYVTEFEGAKIFKKGSFNMQKSKPTSLVRTPRQFTYKGAGGGI